MWDLHRNGGSVAATTERILTGRGLETVSRDGFPILSFCLRNNCYWPKVLFREVTGVFPDCEGSSVNGTL